MKVIYKKSVLQQILEASIESGVSGKTVDKILLTKEEYNQLVRELRHEYEMVDEDFPITTLNGISLEVAV